MDLFLIFLLTMYVLCLIFQIILLIKCCKKNVKWKVIFIIEILSIIISAFLAIYYNGLPGSGFMPGLTYIGHFLFSFIAAILYTILLFITIILKLCFSRKTLIVKLKIIGLIVATIIIAVFFLGFNHIIYL